MEQVGAVEVDVTHRPHSSPSRRRAGRTVQYRARKQAANLSVGPLLTRAALCRSLSCQPQATDYLLEGGSVNAGFILRRDGDDVKHPSVGGDCRVGRVDLDDAVDRRWT